MRKKQYCTYAFSFSAWFCVAFCFKRSKNRFCTPPTSKRALRCASLSVCPLESAVYYLRCSSNFNNNNWMPIRIRPILILQRRILFNRFCCMLKLQLKMQSPIASRSLLRVNASTYLLFLLVNTFLFFSIQPLTNCSRFRTLIL